MRLVVLLVFPVLFAIACGPAPLYYKFAPYTAASVNRPPVTDRAIRLYPGDVAALPSSAEYLGLLTAANGEEAAIIAARLGGTHVYLTRDESYTTSEGTRCSYNPFLKAVRCRELTDTHTIRQYAVMFVPQR